MADKLSVYNGALVTHLDTRPLRTLTDARTERRALDAVWEATLEFMIEQGMWNFAIRSDQWMPSETAVPEFGFRNYYEKPDDYVRLASISDNEDLSPTLMWYKEEGDYFLSDIDVMYVSYISNATDCGADPGKWGASFASAFEAELAWRGQGGCKPLGINEKDGLWKLKKRLLQNAQSKDVVNQAPTELPPGRLVRSRMGAGRGNNRMRRTPYV